MSKALVVADDGLSREIKWDYSGLRYDVHKLSFMEDQSGKGTCLEGFPRNFLARDFVPNWHVTDLLPVNAVEWANKEYGPFDLAVIGPNRGLNLGDKSYFSSSSIAMAKVLSHYGVKCIVISMDTKKEKFSLTGSRRLCSMVNLLSVKLDSSYITSLNFVCADPVLAKTFVIRSLPDEQNILFEPRYTRQAPEWFYSLKSSRVKGYNLGTVVFSLMPRY